MIIKWRRKVQKHGDSLQVTIPTEICEAFKIKEGDIVLINVEGERTFISKATNRRRD